MGPFEKARFAPEFSVGWQIFHQPLLPSIASSPFLSSPAQHVHEYLHLRDNLLEASSRHDSLVITCYMHSPQGQTGEGDIVLHARSLRTSVNENVHRFVELPGKYKPFSWSLLSQPPHSPESAWFTDFSALPSNANHLASR